MCEISDDIIAIIQRQESITYQPCFIVMSLTSKHTQFIFQCNDDKQLVIHILTLSLLHPPSDWLHSAIQPILCSNVILWLLSCQHGFDKSFTVTVRLLFGVIKLLLPHSFQFLHMPTISAFYCSTSIRLQRLLCLHTHTHISIVKKSAQQPYISR